MYIGSSFATGTSGAAGNSFRIKFKTAENIYFGPNIDGSQSSLILLCLPGSFQHCRTPGLHSAAAAGCCFHETTGRKPFSPVSGWPVCECRNNSLNVCTRFSFLSSWYFHILQHAPVGLFLLSTPAGRLRMMCVSSERGQRGASVENYSSTLVWV